MAGVGLRMAGVIASKAVGRSLAHSREMCPLGLIVVLDRSVEECSGPVARHP